MEAAHDRAPKVAVIGSGYWGKNLVRNYHELGALRFICDKSDDALSRFRAMYPGVETSMALSEVLACAEVAGVVIATPAGTHFDLARESLLAGKHVYVEKPLVLHEHEAQALIDLADELGLVLMVGHLLQYHPIFVRLKELVASGELGRINYIYSNRLNLGKIRREENILWSFAPHDISMILALTGEDPAQVLATGGNYLHRSIADVTVSHLEFPSGLKAHIFVSWLHPFKEQKLVVVGERKMAVFDDTLDWQDKLLLFPHEIRWENNVPVPSKSSAERFDIPRSEPLRNECLHFLSKIVSGGVPLTDGREGLRVLRVLKACQRALDNSGGRVTLGEARAPGAAIVHPTACVDEGAVLGKGTKIWHFSHILPETRIGESCTIGQNVVVGPNVTVGNRCKIQNNVSVFKGVTLEDDVFCGPSMVFTNVYNPRAAIRRMDELRPTLVRRGATIGANATVVCGNTVGRYAMVGAGSVVTRDVPDHALVYGNPARQRGWVCECGVSLGSDLTCPACGAGYAAGAFGLRRLEDGLSQVERQVVV